MTGPDPPPDSDDGDLEEDLHRLEGRLRYLDAYLKANRQSDHDSPLDDKDRRRGSRWLYVEFGVVGVVILVMIVWPIVGAIRAIFP